MCTSSYTYGETVEGDLKTQESDLPWGRGEQESGDTGMERDFA